METDYSLQFRLIRETFNGFYTYYGHEPKIKRLAISSTYGFLTIADTEREFATALTDVFEQRQYCNPEEGSLWHRGRETDYTTKISLVKLGFNCNGRVLAVDATTRKGSFIYLYDAAVLAPNLSFVAYAVNKIKLVGPMPKGPVEKKPLKPGTGSSESEYYERPELKTKITTVEWNPANSRMLAVATYETLFVILFNLDDALNHRILAKMDTTAPITAFSWNPAGTQLTVGDADGRIHQFNPRLKLIFTVNPPDLTPSVFPDKFACSGLCWVSKTERIVIFTSETSDKLHLTKLTVKPNKPPKWTVWDVLPAAESTEFGKTFNFLPIFKWNMVLMSSTCLTKVYTFGIVNNVWKPFKLDDRFTIKTPLDKGQKTVITSMSINYSSQKSVSIGSEFPNMPPQPVIYLTTTNDKILIYHLVSLDSNRPILFKPAQSIDKDNLKNGPAPKKTYEYYTDTDSDVQETNYVSDHDSLDDNVYSDDDDKGDTVDDFFQKYQGYNSYDDNDSDDSDSDDGDYGYSRNRKPKAPRPVVYTKKKCISTEVATKDVNIQVKVDHDGTSDEATILKLQEEISRMQESILRTNDQVAKATCLRLRAMGKLSAAGVLEVFIAENDKSNKVMDIGNRWAAMYRSETKLISEMKCLDCKLSADEFVSAVLSILDKPESKALSLDPENGIGIKDSVFSKPEQTVLEAICGAMACKFIIL